MYVWRFILWSGRNRNPWTGRHKHSSKLGHLTKRDWEKNKYWMMRSLCSFPRIMAQGLLSFSQKPLRLFFGQSDLFKRYCRSHPTNSQVMKVRQWGGQDPPTHSVVHSVKPKTAYIWEKPLRWELNTEKKWSKQTLQEGKTLSSEMKRYSNHETRD